ncbi:MAG: hypothetical protein ACXW36_11570, partial [Nitrospira sp.]
GLLSQQAQKPEEGNTMQKLKSVRLSVLAAFLLALGVTACGETWRGAKEDTRENVKTTGEGVEKAGEKIQKQAD